MQEIAKAKFVLIPRASSVLEQIRRGPVGPPTWAELSGEGAHDLKPGRRYFPNKRRIVRPGKNASREQVEAFLLDFFDLGAERIPQKWLEIRIRDVCKTLGWREFTGKAESLADSIQPKHMRKLGAPNLGERKAISAWDERTKAKCERLKDEVNAELEEFPNL